ncbi:hypothetical protein GBAR_LOCUS29537 [Geodia barretti]|uniref:Uncharacterized protein n=1 Tax=Geodia barretti TaxID=519541 RepID=A0AA35XE25_GEOBA|nr:hypothetical protein GBAR_LOCUS29537 [Geodia barretti]
MSVHQTFIEPDPSLLVESPGAPTILSDSEADSQPEDGYEFSPSPPPAKKVSSLWSKEGVASMDQESADDEEHSNTPSWAVELRSGLETPSSQLTMASSEESSVTTPLTTPSTRLGKRKRLLPKLAPDASPSTSSTCSNNSDILQQILLEVKCSNKALKDKVTQLEKTVNALEKTAQSKKKMKVAPSREERDAVRKVYKSLSDSGDDDFGWNMESCAGLLQQCCRH